MLHSHISDCILSVWLKISATTKYLLNLGASLTYFLSGPKIEKLWQPGSEIFIFKLFSPRKEANRQERTDCNPLRF